MFIRPASPAPALSLAARRRAAAFERPEAACEIAGDIVEVGKTVCLVEAMKMFNEIEAEFKCKIVEILKDDAAPVEFGEPLFRVERI